MQETKDTCAENVSAEEVVKALEESHVISCKMDKLMQERKSDIYFPRTAEMYKKVFQSNRHQVLELSRLLLETFNGNLHKHIDVPGQENESHHEVVVPLNSLNLSSQPEKPKFSAPTIGGLNSSLVTSFESSTSSNAGFKRKLTQNDIILPDVFNSPSKKRPRLRKSKECTFYDSNSNKKCSTKAIGSSGLCKRHGGGKRCAIDGCLKASQGKSGLCVAHGGGKRCLFEDCNRLARGKTEYCIPHGGGVRCSADGCSKLAQGGTKLCIRHGGGRRCQYVEESGTGMNVRLVKCNKSAVSSTHFCVAHGGGKRCKFDKCDKSAVGGTEMCVRHGGGKRCSVTNCTRSAVGKTDLCISHGGSR